MKISEYFFYTSKEAPASAEIASHKLMLQAGFVAQSSSGIYTWLPLGLKVLNKVANIIRDEQAKQGIIEILMPTIQSANLWLESNRYDSYGAELLRFKDRRGQEMLYGPTNEEMMTDIFRKYVKTYKDLPKIIHHIQWKFRDEIRPRFGVMRGREFLMEDAYSFDLSFEEAKRTYDKIFKMYIKIFKRMGLTPIPVQADSGAIGGNMSHEFQILADTGESTLYYDKEILNITDENDFLKIKDLYAVTDEKYDPAQAKGKVLSSSRGIEVGHIFHFGTKYTESMHAKVIGKDGNSLYPFMGSYGIGVSRLVGAIIEAFHDEKGMIWPIPVAPFDVALIELASKSDEVQAFTEELYSDLMNNNIDVIYDDRKNVSNGNKFNDMDLIGIPFQIIIGNKYATDKTVEVKVRKTGERIDFNSKEALLKYLSSELNKN